MLEQQVFKACAHLMEAFKTYRHIAAISLLTNFPRRNPKNQTTREHAPIHGNCLCLHQRNRH